MVVLGAVKLKMAVGLEIVWNTKDWKARREEHGRAWNHCSSWTCCFA